MIHLPSQTARPCTHAGSKPTKKVNKTKIRRKTQKPKASHPQINEKRREAENELVGARPTPIEEEKLKLPYPDRSDKGSHKMRKPKRATKTGPRIKKAGWQKNLPPETADNASKKRI